jgi:hypothetical protein
MSERANALGEFMVTYHVETDRAAGILVGVGLEGRLENLLISYLADWEDLRERVFAENRPLGTLSAKIDLVFVLGLLSAEHRKVLDSLRRIRNHCAHEPKARFTDAPIRDLAANAFAPWAADSPQPSNGPMSSLSLPRYQVLVSAFIMFMLLEIWAIKVGSEQKRVVLPNFTVEQLKERLDFGSV